MNVPLAIWIALIAGILLMLAVDLLKHRDAHEIGLREAGTWTAIWVAVGVGVGAAIWWHYGAEFGLQYFGGYLVEKSLAVDNVFVWALLLAHFAVPARYQHRVLFYGVIGALVFRAVFIAAGSVLIASASWVLYLFGVFLILTGVKMITTREQHVDPERSWSLRIARRLIPVSDEYHGQRFWVRQGGVLMATPLLLVLVVIEFTDILFAVDSIPAIFAITQEPFL
ncbi:MAG: TerC/Alx family metal homeostasis membrane protein, partial [Candidatus Nanopelagicales bacterium]|nr:TerC/Alx family metal homeostasis membrane protein [Candidatus Nanopelagicales bacterium]